MAIVIPGSTHLVLFLGAALVLLVIPGPAVLYIVGRSIDQGWRGGFLSILGIHSATLVHVLAATLGLSALLASSALAFSAVKYAGAAYLIWLGFRKVLSRPEAAQADAPPRRVDKARLFRDGFVVNLLNPKTAIFFLAFLPQFAEPGLGHLSSQIAVLGLLFTVLGLLSDGCYALVAGAAADLLKQSTAYQSVERYVAGLLMIGLGMTAAFVGSDSRK